MNKNWTPEMDQEMLKLIDGGLSFQKISEKIGRTRNSIASRVKRLGKAVARKGKYRIVPKIYSQTPFKPSEIASKAYGEKKTLAELPDKCCRWPVDDAKHFCGAYIGCYGYCENHTRIAWQKK